MSWLSFAAIYLLVWTATLFAVLPIGVRTPDETGDDKVKGQADSAPIRPMIGRKLLLTTAISAVIMAALVLADRAGLFAYN
jgi:predicted secreted protein